MARARMRRAATAVVMTVAVAATLAGAGPAAPAGATPAITVTPTTGLQDGQPVTITGSGLPPGTAFTVAQCGGSQPDTCATEMHIAGSDGHYVYPSNLDGVGTDAAGSFSLTLIAQRSFSRIETGSNTVDCTVASCTIGVMGPGDDTFVPITFEPTGTYDWPDAHLMAVPTIGVVEHQAVSLQVSGLNPRGGPLSHTRVDAHAHVEVCRAVEAPGPDDCRGGWNEPLGEIERLPFLVVERDGTTHGSLRVTRYLELPGGTVDCAVVGCTIAVSQGDPVSNRVPLSFGPEWAPFGSLSSFLDEVGFVRGRALTGDERSALAAALTSRTSTGPDALVAAAEQSLTDPSPAIRTLVDTALLYRAFFGRAPETAGLVYWSERMLEGLTPLEAGRAFGGTAEFRRTYGTATNAKVVTLAYRNTLGRAPDAAGLAYWTGRLDQGLARWKVIYGFGRSTEFAARERMRTTITVLVRRLAGRAPTGRELLGVPDELEDHGSIRNVAVGLLASGEVL